MTLQNTGNLFQEGFEQSLADQKVSDINERLSWILTHKSKDELIEILPLNKHKSVSVKRKLAEVLGALGEDKEIEFLSNWQNIEADRKTWILLESAIDRIKRRKNGDKSDVRALSVTEALSLIKNLIAEKTYIIEGEVTEANISGQMYYFNIKDADESVLSCWCFAGIIYRAGFPLNEGLSIRVTGKFKISSKSSRLYFDVQKLELTGEGEFLRNLKLLEEKLKNEGMMDESRKRKPSILPQKILLVASSNSAALTDFIKVINQRRQGLTIYHLPIKTQGVGVEGEILEKFARINLICDTENIDTVVITRGGGSKEDLIVFNSEKVVRAIHAINKPTIVAIGHERDHTLAEMVADLRASTPSQAAELSSLSSNEVVQSMDNTFHKLIAYIKEKKYAYHRFTDQVCLLLVAILQQDIQRKKQITRQIDQVVTALIYSVRMENTKIVENSLDFVRRRLYQSKYKVGVIVNLEKPLLEKTMSMLHTSQVIYPTIVNYTFSKLQKIKQDTVGIFTRIEIENPQNILKKGYAIIKNKGKIIDGVASLSSGDVVEISMTDGVRHSVVK